MYLKSRLVTGQFSAQFLLKGCHTLEVCSTDFLINLIHKCASVCIIHPIHIFKLSDWLNESHITWVIFSSVHILQYPNVVIFTISLFLEEAVTIAEF